MSRRRAAAALVSVVALVVTALTAPLATPLGAPAAAAVDAPVPALNWVSCGSSFGRAECATALAPLDYDDPTGDTTRLDVLRMPAREPTRRIGTLFVNPGGPGVSSREFALFFEQFVPRTISNRYDIVGVDPRGVGPSRPMICHTNRKRPRSGVEFFPVTRREVRRTIAVDKWVRRACRTDSAPIVDHMTTADTARDMDLIRQALGNQPLRYYGISYGTQLGTTYAAMFPGQVGAMILDGVLDPVAWSGTPATAGRPFSERVNSGIGAWQSLTKAFAECDRVGRKRCPLAGDAAGVWRDIIRHVRKGRDKRTGLTYADVVGTTLGYLYDAHTVRILMRDLKSLHREMFGRGPVKGRSWLRRAADARDTVRDDVIPGPYSAGGFARVSNSEAGVMCADSLNPGSERTWVKAAKRADRRSPWFGALWTWVSGVCAGWPSATKADRFKGSYAVNPEERVLVVGNRYDPATPLHGARTVHRLLERSRLLVMDGWGHGALGTGPCINEAYADYLIDGTLPAAGAVCPMRDPLFPKKKR